jgi:type I restriction enzyme S subunit
MRFGLAESDIKRIQDVFAVFPEIRSAVIYGSRAKGNFKPGSDIDLTLHGEFLTTALLAKVSSQLDDLLLPYTFDISIFDEIDHVKLREHIERVGKMFYERSVLEVYERGNGYSGVVMKEGWKIKRIGDVCSLMTGGTPSKTKSEHFGCGFKWLVSGDIHQGEIFDCEGRITEAGMKNSNAKLLPVNSVMIALNGQGKTRGTVALLRTQATCNQSLVCIHPNDPEKLLPEYLYANLLGRYQEIRQMTGDSGNDRRGLNMDLIRSIEIPIAPPEEQRLIVRILDEAFAGIATAKANAETNLQNARAIFECHLNSVFTQRGEGWVERRLGDLSRINYGYTESASAEKTGPHFLRITDIKDNRVDWATVPYCPIDVVDLPKFKLADNDIVFARTGATTGKSYLVIEPPSAVFASYLIRVQLINKELLPQFVNLFFQTRSYWEVIRSGVSGSAQGGFNAAKLGELVIPYPFAIQEQQVIINELNELQAETRSLESIYQRKLTALEELKKSLLHQAFSGEL